MKDVKKDFRLIRAFTMGEADLNQQNTSCILTTSAKQIDSKKVRTNGKQSLLEILKTLQS